MNCLNYLKTLDEKTLNTFLYGVYRRGVKDGQTGVIDGEDEYCGCLASKDAECVAATIQSETDVVAYDDFKKANSEGLSKMRKFKDITVGDFLYICDYDVKISVEKLQEDDTFYVEPDPYSEEHYDKVILSLYVKSNEEGEPIIHLSVED